MLIVWDEQKRQTNLQDPPDGHGLDFADAHDWFEWDTAMVWPTYPSRHGGGRFVAVGYLDGELLTLVFAPLGSEAISAISLRTSSNRERKRYARS